MTASSSTSSPLMSFVLILGIVVILNSPKMLRTLGRMILIFIIAALLIMVPAALVRRGDPEMWGEMAAQIGMVIAVGGGLWHVLSLKRAAKQAEEPPKTSLP